MTTMHADSCECEDCTPCQCESCMAERGDDGTVRGNGCPCAECQEVFAELEAMAGGDGMIMEVFTEHDYEGA